MALYHKHRPQLWSDVIGQEVIVTTIQNQIKNKRPSHAYLLGGPRGVGKTTTARLIAKSLDCEKRKEDSAEPCNECSSCAAIAGGSAIDVIEIDAASHTGVDAVREFIIENSEFRPTSSPYKIFIIDEAHMLSGSSFNALLKTIEEPPEYAIFILATTEIHKVPGTILSRCQRYIFKKIPRDLLVERLKKIAKEENISVDEQVLTRLVKKSEGSARDAVSLFDQISAVSDGTISDADAQLFLPATPAEQIEEFIQAIAHKDIQTGLKIIKTVIESGVTAPQFLSDSIDFARGILLFHFDPDIARKECEIPADEEIKSLCLLLPPPRLLAILDSAMKRLSEAKQATIPELPLELFLIELCSPPLITIPGQTENKTNEIPKKINESHTNTKVKNSELESNQETNDKIESKQEKKEFSKAQNLERSAVESALAECIHSFESTNPSLVFLLKMAELKEIAGGNTARFAVKFRLHYDKLNTATIKKKLTDELSAILGQQINLEFTVEEDAGSTKTAELNDLAAVFGGEVV